MRKSVWLLTLFALLLTSLVYAQITTSTCSSKSVCGVVPASSADGYGMVEFCGECHACGLSDGICPEDFVNDGVRGNCTKCPDPDCTVYINGSLRIFGRPDAQVPSGIKIYAFYESAPNEGVYIATSKTNGFYNATIPSGEITLLVKDPYWDSQPKEVNLVRGGNYSDINISIIEGTCNEDCTDSFGIYCRAHCNGINGCNYTPIYGYEPEYLANLCEYTPKGNEVQLFENDDKIYNYVCCNQGVTSLLKQKVDVARLNNQFIKNLRSTKIPIVINGQIKQIVFTVWDRKD